MRAILSFCLAVGLLSAPAVAQDYPSRPVRLVVGFAPGGGTDICSRIIAEKLSPRLGTPVIVENRVGAAGVIAAGFVARSAPDGYKLLVGTQGSVAIAPYTQRPQPFDPLTDFAPVSMLMVSQMQLYVRDDFPARSFPEFVALVRAAPGRYAYATAGIAGPAHMFTELLSRRIGLRMEHIAYPGDGRP